MNRLPRNRYCANLERSTSPQSKRDRANFGSRSTRRIAHFGSCNGIVLCGIPYRGEGHLPRLAQRTGLFTPFRAGYPITIGLLQEAPLLISNFLRVSLLALKCKPHNFIHFLLDRRENACLTLPVNLYPTLLPAASELLSSRLQLFENSNGLAGTQGQLC
jgi:hypothetical protein